MTRYCLQSFALVSDGPNMTNEQSNKLKMAQATQQTIAVHEAEWSGIPGYVQAVATLDTTVSEIADRSRAQSARSGHAAAKEEAFEDMVNAAFLVCSGLKALASATGDTKLSAEVDYSRSNLARGREVGVMNRCQTILELGTANAEALAKYNVSATDLKALKSANEAFGEAQPKPRQRKAVAAAATQDLAKLFETLDGVLNNQLDPLTEKFRRTSPAFYHEYRTARSIVDSAATHEAKDPAAAAPVPKAA